ncbi:MAG: hypothetical protein RR215_03970 [Ruthenibacterium sp.]
MMPFSIIAFFSNHKTAQGRFIGIGFSFLRGGRHCLPFSAAACKPLIFPVARFFLPLFLNQLAFLIAKGVSCKAYRGCKKYQSLGKML